MARPQYASASNIFFRDPAGNAGAARPVSPQMLVRRHATRPRKAVGWHAYILAIGAGLALGSILPLVMSWSHNAFHQTTRSAIHAAR